MSGLRYSMLVKLSLFVLIEVSTDRRQFGRRLPSDYQQEGSNLPSISSYTPPHAHRNDRTHASWQHKDLFCPWKARNMTASDTCWCEMGIGPRPTYFLSAGYIRVSCGLYGLLLVFCDDIGEQIPTAYSDKVLSLLKTCLWANRTCVRARSVWNTDRCVLSAGNCGQQKIVPRNLAARLARECVTGA